MNVILIPVVTVCVIKAAVVYPILELEEGQIKGISKKTSTGKIFYSFKEIPYAKPPLGDLRFSVSKTDIRNKTHSDYTSEILSKEPLPPEKWNGVRDATENTKLCMQKKPIHEDQTSDPRENEDCLYLNVFTPNLNNKDPELLPVYVYIHGGMFIGGNPTEYDFQGFLDEDIVVVTMNYRLATLGLMATDDGVISGNLFLKDQIQAIKWVNKNIKHFGGNPAKVTIGGHSSGATSIGYHILNKKTQGLFRAGILQSGSALAPGYTLNATEKAYCFAEEFDSNVRSKNTHELLKLVRTIPADVITRADHQKPFFKKITLLGNNSLPWNPVIENSKFENAAISGPMHDNYENGISNHVPLLMGITDEEATIMDVGLELAEIDRNLSAILDNTMNIKPENWSKAVIEIKDMYTQSKTLIENITGLAQLTSDMIIGLPVMNQAYLHSKYANVFFYQFSYKGSINGLEKWRNGPYFHLKGLGKAEHCAELPLMYYYRLDPMVKPSEDDLLMRKRLIKLWSNFIKYLNPTPKKDPLFQNITWLKMTKANYKYLDISSNMTIKTNPRRFVEWKNIIEKYFEHPRYVL